MCKYYFFIGTEAELIKLFPVIMEMGKRRIEYRIIASGQNDISKSRVLLAANGGRIDLQISNESDIVKSAKGLLGWYITTRGRAYNLMRKRFNHEINHDSVMIVHGDTVSTVMGAYLGKRLGMKVAHIEAGLRSHNWLNPFPEEIDRMLVSRIADYSFAPGEQAVANLSRHKGVYNTKENTLVDSLKYALSKKCTDGVINDLSNKDYFVFVLHRQENLENEQLISLMLNVIDEESKKMKCVLILHKITEIKFSSLNILQKYKDNPNFVLLPRVDYFDFMKLLNNSKYVITDGGSNQEELSYMGKPALILRKNTERNEGLNSNAVLWGGDNNLIEKFVQNYDQYRCESIDTEISPSDFIINTLEQRCN